jgi:superfamily II DNA or RNA helicase
VETASTSTDQGVADVVSLDDRVGRVALQLTFVPSGPVPAASWFAAWDAGGGGDDDLRAALRDLELPAGEPGRLTSPLVREGSPVRNLPLLPTVRVLAGMPGRSGWPAWDRPADSLLAWSLAAKLALEVVTAGRLVPVLHATTSPDTGMAAWRARPPRDGRTGQLAALLPPAAHAVERRDGTLLPADDAVAAFLDAIADACGRQGHRPDRGRRRRGVSARPWVELWPEALAGGDPAVVPLRLPSDEVEADVEEWVAPAHGQRTRGTVRLALRVVPPGVGDGGTDDMPARLAAVDAPWHVELLLQSTLDPDATAPAADVWAGRVRELADRRVDDAEDTLVLGLAEAARVFPPLDRALDQAHPERVELTAGEASQLLADGVDELARAGVGLLVPPELREVNARRLRARIRIGQTTGTAGRVESEGMLARSDVASFAYEMALGDDTLTADEFAEIVSLKRSLVRWRGEWVRIDHDETDRIAELAGQSGTMQLTEAVAAALAGQAEVDDDLGWIEATAAGDVGALVDRLRSGPEPDEARIVAIEGDLRDYQRRGVAWMQRMADLGAGGILADEMGLGKTVQAIALLTSRKQDRPHLVVAPTSVVGNWEREVRRFAPRMPVIRHHGPDRPRSPREFPPAHAVLTSYALLRRDAGLLAQVDWDVVVFDEAQQIKNASSKGAKAARAMPARTRFAMTGTPIENRLSELWSILDVTNPGLLGSQRRFNERFAVPIERWRDDEAADRLKRLIAPFVVRRRKADPDVSVDLPPKQQITVACSLTREQASLYQAAIDQAFQAGLGSTAFERRGRILALLTALKQICNHPAQYVRDGGRLPGRSGKLSRATEILGEIVANGDHALVFTQFREMGELLAAHLKDELDLPEVPFLHGGTPMATREQMVDRFQEAEDAPPILLVSLRAGGTGLNLTRATEVIHYDRWWNPAVEDQATDRVHRIGQTRPVTVHRLVTSGTIEERIADLLERKRALADAVVGEGETWITELDDEDLRELVALSSDDVEDDEDAA